MKFFTNKLVITAGLALLAVVIGFVFMTRPASRNTPVAMAKEETVMDKDKKILVIWQ